MKIKTADLNGPPLAYAVCLADGWEPGTADMAPYLFFNGRIKPHADWAQGGPIIDREKIDLIYYGDGGHERGGEWIGARSISGEDEEIEMYGPTPLTAAMRCYVASKLGDEVDVPEELV